MGTLTTAARCLLLGATGAEGTPGASEPMLTPSPEVAPALNPEAVDFDALPERPRTSDDVRIQRFPGAFTGGVVGLGAMAGLFVPLLALEWSHTNALEASLPKFVFSAAPTPNGGMVGASMRF